MTARTSHYRGTFWNNTLRRFENYERPLAWGYVGSRKFESGEFKTGVLNFPIDSTVRNLELPTGPSKAKTLVVSG